MGHRHKSHRPCRALQIAQERHRSVDRRITLLAIPKAHHGVLVAYQTLLRERQEIAQWLTTRLFSETAIFQIQARFAQQRQTAQQAYLAQPARPPKQKIPAKLQRLLRRPIPRFKEGQA